MLYVAHQFPQINHSLSLLDTFAITLSQTIYLFETNLDLLANTWTLDTAQDHLEQNLTVTASCLHCWFTGLTKREIPIQYYTSMKTYTHKCMMSQVCNDCTYRQNTVSQVLSEDVRLNINTFFISNLVAKVQALIQVKN